MIAIFKKIHEQFKKKKRFLSKKKQIATFNHFWQYKWPVIALINKNQIDCIVIFYTGLCLLQVLFTNNFFFFYIEIDQKELIGTFNHFLQYKWPVTAIFKKNQIVRVVLWFLFAATGLCLLPTDFIY